MINAPEKHDVAVGQVATQVAGLVHPAPRRAERVRDEFLGREVRSIEIAARQARPANVNFPRHPHLYRIQPLIQDIDLRVRYRSADGHQRSRIPFHPAVG